MALDRIIKWQEDFFSDCCEISWKKDRWFILLPGHRSYALARIVPDFFKPEGFKELDLNERWIEVWPSDTCLFVMTRQQDEFTNGLAEMLTKIIGKYWRASLEGT